MVAAVDTAAGEVDADVTVFEFVDPRACGEAVPGDDLPRCCMCSPTEDGNGVAVRVKVAGEELTYLSGAAGNDDLHDEVSRILFCRSRLGWKVALPVGGFRDLLDNGVALAKECKHVAAEEDDFGEWAEDGKGSGDAEEIFHLGRAGGEGAKVVIGLHGAEDAFHHGGLEVGWRLHGGEFAGEILPDAEVFCAPGDLL
jgi:hypothetical protein